MLDLLNKLERMCCACEPIIDLTCNIHVEFRKARQKYEELNYERDALKSELERVKTLVVERVRGARVILEGIMGEPLEEVKETGTKTGTVEVPKLRHSV